MPIAMLNSQNRCADSLERSVGDGVIWNGKRSNVWNRLYSQPAWKIYYYIFFSPFTIHDLCWDHLLEPKGAVSAYQATEIAQLKIRLCYVSGKIMDLTSDVESLPVHTASSFPFSWQQSDVAWPSWCTTHEGEKVPHCMGLRRERHFALDLFRIGVWWRMLSSKSHGFNRNAKTVSTYFLESLHVETVQCSKNHPMQTRATARNKSSTPKSSKDAYRPGMHQVRPDGNVTGTYKHVVSLWRVSRMSHLVYQVVTVVLPQIVAFWGIPQKDWQVTMPNAHTHWTESHFCFWINRVGTTRLARCVVPDPSFLRTFIRSIECVQKCVPVARDGLFDSQVYVAAQTNWDIGW